MQGHVGPACIARPPPAQEPTAVPAQALSVACPGQGSAQHQCCQSPADGPGDAQQQQPRPCAAAAQGAAQCGGDVSRRNAGAAAPPSWAQQLPGSGPPTPEAACEAESVSGELRHRAAEQPGHAPGATAAAAAVCAADALSDDPAGDLLMLRRLQSFVHCVAGSPLVQSALLFLEHVGEHPSALPASQAAAGPAGRASAAGLEWTLSQLLALWLRAGYTHACESALLGALWVLESSHNAWRSSAAVCLASYTKLIGACAPEVVKRLTADWPAAFTKLRHALVQAQMELLQRTGWRVRLDLAADVLPCHALLFCPALVCGNQLQLGLPPALALPPAVAAMQEWAPTMRRLCAVIREKSRRLKAHEQATEAARVQATEAARVPTPECEDEGERPAKRPRPDSNP